MAVNAPRARLRPFSGGPLGIGWAPWAIGAAALAVGVFVFVRRGRPQAAAAQAGPAAGASMPLTSQPSVQVFPFPTGPQAQTGAGNPSAQQLKALWQFGVPPQGPTVWQATQTGVQNFQASTGGPWPGGVYPNLPDQPTQSALGRFGWQWATVPPQFDPTAYAQALNNPSAQQLSSASQGLVNFAA